MKTKRGKKYNKKTFRRKKYNKKTFRKKSYKKKTLKKNKNTARGSREGENTANELYEARNNMESAKETTNFALQDAKRIKEEISKAWHAGAHRQVVGRISEVIEAWEGVENARKNELLATIRWNKAQEAREKYITETRVEKERRRWRRLMDEKDAQKAEEEAAQRRHVSDNVEQWVMRIPMEQRASEISHGIPINVVPTVVGQEAVEVVFGIPVVNTRIGVGKKSWLDGVRQSV